MTIPPYTTSLEKISTVAERRVSTELTWHLTKSPDSRPHAKSTLTAKFHRDETKRLVTRWDESEFSATEYAWRQESEFWLGEHTSRVFLHHLFQLQGGKFSVQVYDRANTDQLDL